MAKHYAIHFLKLKFSPLAFFCSLLLFNTSTSTFATDIFWFWQHPSAKQLRHIEEHHSWKFIHSIEDLRAHFETHRLRVRALAVALINQHPHLLVGRLTSHDVQDFIALHDLAKMVDTPEFRFKFWPEEALGKANFLQRLYEIYGSKLFPNDEQKHEQALELIQELNWADANVGRKYFQAKGFLKPNGALGAEAQALLRIERIADVVDRNSDPVAQEELGVRVPKPLSDFFENKDGTLQEENLEMAIQLRTQFTLITKGLSYNEITQFPALVQKALQKRENEILIGRVYNKYLANLSRNTQIDCGMILDHNSFTIFPRPYPTLSRGFK